MSGMYMSQMVEIKGQPAPPDELFSPKDNTRKISLDEFEKYKSSPKGIEEGFRNYLKKYELPCQIDSIPFYAK